jgi:predicted Zn-dependent protease with MMP-like domain
MTSSGAGHGAGRSEEGTMGSDEFEALVAEALDSLPDEFLEKLDNVEVVVGDWPTLDDLAEVGLDARDRRGLLGLYHGVPQTRRGVGYMQLPDLITIFRIPIETAAGGDPERIKDQVRRTVIHEIAHYYGIDDERLDELGWG